MLKKIFFIAIIVTVMGTSAYAKEYYVNCEVGNDSNAGTLQAPFATIQRAAEVVEGGDTVTVLPGVYYGPVNITTAGTEDNPIIFKTEKQGENVTVITNANQEIRENSGDLWECIDEERNIWVTDYTVQKNANIDTENPDWLFPAALLCSDVDIIPYSSYEGLRDLIYYSDGATYLPGYPQGYYYDHGENKLYLRMRKDGKYGSGNPNDHTVKVAPSIYKYISSDGEWGGTGWCGNAMGRDSYNICVGEYDGALSQEEQTAPSYNVIIDGFTLETPGFTGVFLRASDVTVKNCYFRGCRTGVRGASRVRYDDLMYSKNIIIEHCDYSRYPTFNDAEDLIFAYDGDEVVHKDYIDEEGMIYDLYTYFWWQRKGYNKDFNYESGGFTNFMGEYWTLRYNYIHDCFDGISYQAMQKYATSDAVEIGARYIEIYGNKFEKCLDNAIEVENHARDIRIYDNLFHNNFVPFSWQPLNGTPWPTNIRFYNNVIHNTRDFNEFWHNKAGFKNFAFKIGANKSNWETNSWMTDAEWDDAYDIPTGSIDAEDEGVWIFNNSVIMPGANLFSNVGGTNMYMVPFSNFRFVNNAVVCDFESIKAGAGGVDYATIASKCTGIAYSNNVFSADSLIRADITDDFLKNGKYIYNADNMGFNLLTRLRFDPGISEDSPLKNAGILDRHEPEMSVDVGASFDGMPEYSNVNSK